MSPYTIERMTKRGKWVKVRSVGSEKDALKIARKREAAHRRRTKGRWRTYIEKTGRQVGMCRVLGPDGRDVRPDRNIWFEALSEYLKRSSEERDFVPLAEDLRDLARKLHRMAKTLGEKRWGLLKSSVDWGPPATAAHKSNAGRYDATRVLLPEIANRAREEAGLLPDRRIKDHYDWATDVFLNLWLDAGKGWPILSETSEAVVALEKVFEDARNCLLYTSPSPRD